MRYAAIGLPVENPRSSDIHLIRSSWIFRNVRNVAKARHVNCDNAPSLSKSSDHESYLLLLLSFRII
jgi:hypothetical protein